MSKPTGSHKPGMRPPIGSAGASVSLGLPMSFAPLLQARQALYVQHNAMMCLRHLNDPTLRARLERNGQSAWPQVAVYVELGGYALLSQQQYEAAAQHFAQVGRRYLAGYAWMLAGDMEQARQQWVQLVPQRGNHWCVHLFGMVTKQLTTYPTFLQVRNHLEADISHLVTAGQEESLANVLAALDTLAQSNPEAYKLAGRALMNVNRLAPAKPLLLRAQSILPQDAEIYFHLGQLYARSENWREARLMLRQCLAINACYTPAQWLLEKVQGNLG